MSSREFGVVVYGATGYTGRLVCEYLNKQYGVNGDVKWAMAVAVKKSLNKFAMKWAFQKMCHL